MPALISSIFTIAFIFTTNTFGLNNIQSLIFDSLAERWSVIKLDTSFLRMINPITMVPFYDITLNLTIWLFYYSSRQAIVFYSIFFILCHNKTDDNHKPGTLFLPGTHKHGLKHSDIVTIFFTSRASEQGFILIATFLSSESKFLSLRVRKENKYQTGNVSWRCIHIA